MPGACLLPLALLALSLLRLAAADELLNPVTCVVVPFREYGRTGNVLSQMRNIIELLEYCSGLGVLAKAPPGDSAFVVPPMFGTLGNWSSQTMLEQLPIAAKNCRELFEGEVDGNKIYFAEPRDFAKSLNCDTDRKRYSVTQVPVLSGSGSSKIIAFDKRGWEVAIEPTEIAMHFRGGDVMSQGRGFYVQPLCDYYRQAYIHANATCAVLIAEDDSNPCVEVMQRTLPCSRRISCGVTCSLTILARSSILASAKSTFSFAARDMFHDFRKKIFYRPFGVKSKEISAAQPILGRHDIVFATDGMDPWQNTLEQRQIMMGRPCSWRHE